jgi:DNA-binding MarR family transcriptional regulator
MRGAPRSRNIKKSKVSRAADAASEMGDQWLDSFIPYRLYRTTARLNAKLLSKLRVLRINPARWRVLSVLKAYGPLSIGEIAEATLTEQPTVSRVVAQLEKEGRVVRRLSAEDSRVAEISLTKQGVDTFNQIVPAALQHQELALRGISQKDLAALVAILSKIENNIQLYE